MKTKFGSRSYRRKQREITNRQINSEPKYEPPEDNSEIIEREYENPIWEKLTPEAKMLYSVLLSRWEQPEFRYIGDEFEYIFYSDEELKQKTGLSSVSLKKAQEILIASGLLELRGKPYRSYPERMIINEL